MKSLIIAVLVVPFLASCGEPSKQDDKERQNSIQVELTAVSAAQVVKAIAAFEASEKLAIEATNIVKQYKARGLHPSSKLYKAALREVGKHLNSRMDAQIEVKAYLLQERYKELQALKAEREALKNKEWKKATKAFNKRMAEKGASK